MDVTDDQPAGFRLDIDVNLKRYTIHHDGLLFSGKQGAAMNLAFEDLLARLSCHVSHVGVREVSGLVDRFNEVATRIVGVSDNELLDALPSRCKHLVWNATSVKPVNRRLFVVPTGGQEPPPKRIYPDPALQDVGPDHFGRARFRALDHQRRRCRRAGRANLNTA